MELCKLQAKKPLFNWLDWLASLVPSQVEVKVEEAKGERLEARGKMVLQ